MDYIELSGFCLIGPYAYILYLILTEMCLSELFIIQKYDLSLQLIWQSCHLCHNYYSLYPNKTCVYIL